MGRFHSKDNEGKGLQVEVSKDRQTWFFRAGGKTYVTKNIFMNKLWTRKIKFLYANEYKRKGKGEYAPRKKKNAH